MVVAALNILAVCDPGTDYGKRLADYAASRAGYPFELQVFSSLDQLFQYRDRKKPEAILLDSGLYRPKDWETYENPLFLLGNGLSKEDEPDCIFRYQEADSILKEILLLYRAKRPKLQMNVEKRSFSLYAVTDESESCRSEELAFVLAEQLSKNDRVLWLDLRTWPTFRQKHGCSDNDGMGEILYGLCRRKEDLIDQITEKVTSFHGVDLLPEVTDPADLLVVTVKDWKYLFEQLKNDSLYTAVVVVTGNLLQPLCEILELFDVIWIVWEELQMSCHHRMERYMQKTACPQIWQRITGIQLPADTAGQPEDRTVLQQLAKKTLGKDAEQDGRKYTS